MRWQNEGLCRAKGAPLGIARKHAGPEDAVRDAGLRGESLQLRCETGLVRTGHDEARQWSVPRDFRVGFQQQIATFFRVQPARIEQEGLTGGGGESFVKAGNLGLGCGIASRRARRAKRDDLRSPAAEWKALPGKIPLHGRGKKDAVGMGEHTALNGQPIGQLLERFHGIRPVEPGIEHAVSEDSVPVAARQLLKSHNPGVTPETFDDNDLKAACVGTEPSPQERRPAVAFGG